MREIIEHIGEIYSRNKFHRKRGFQIQDQSTRQAACHLVEEAVELMAEFLQPEQSNLHITKEAADVIICLMRILHDCQIDIPTFKRYIQNKLDEIWVDTPEDVLTPTPGFTRRHRNG